MDSLQALKAEPIHLTLTLGDVDALVKSGRFCLDEIKNLNADDRHDLEGALQKLDEAVNL